MCVHVWVCTSLIVCAYSPFKVSASRVGVNSHSFGLRLIFLQSACIAMSYLPVNAVDL